MATPSAVWGSIRTDLANAGKVNLNAISPYFSGAAPQAGDVVIVTSLSGSGSSTTAPTVTVSPGWVEHYTDSFLFFGAYSCVVKVLSKVLTQADVDALTVAAYAVSGETAIIETTGGYGVRGAAYASLGFAGQKLTDGTTNITFPALSAPAGGLVVRSSVPTAIDIANFPNTFPNTFPSGWTRFGLDDNNGNGDNFPAFWHPAPAPLATATTGQANGPYMPNIGFTISLSDVAGPPTLADLELSSYEVPSNAPVGYVAANVLNQTPGSALVARPGMSPKLELVGTEVRIKAALTLGDGLPVNLNEVLAGATGSPKEYGTVIDVVGPVYSDYVASASGTTTLVLPAHQPGDLLVAFLFRDGSTTAPATPAGWTSEATGAGTTCSYRLVWKKATTSAESPGAATTATSTIVSCYRPGPGYVLSMGATSRANGSSTSLTYQSLSMQATDGTSRVAAFAGHRSVNTALETPPAGMVLRHSVVDATDEASAFDTNGGVSSWSAKTVGVSGTSSGWITITFEIKAALDVPPPVGTVTFRAFMIH